MRIIYNVEARVRNFLARPIGRYLIIGGSVFLIEVAIIIIAQSFGASPTLAVGTSFWLGLIISFMLTKLVTFSDKRVHHRVLLPQIIAFSLLVLFNFGFTVLVTSLLQDVVSPVVTRTIALGVTTIWNFYLYRTRIFKAGEVA